MRSTAVKFGIAGLGLYVVSRLLKSVSDSASQFAPRGMQGFERPMVGYDPLAEAIGCAGDGSFDDQGNADGLGFSLKKKFKKSFKKIKKVAFKKPLKVFKKIAIKKPLRALKKSSQLVKRDFRKATQPLVRDFRKAAKLMKTDFSRAGSLFKRGGGRGGGKGGGRPQKYYDENGNELTEAQYNALMAQYEAERAGQSPASQPAGGADQENTPDQTWSMDETAALQFEEKETKGDGATELLAQMFNAEAAGADEAPIGADQFDTYGRAPIGWDGSADDFAASRLPEGMVESTFDVLAAESTSDDSIIMPVDEPATPYSADEMMVAYERPDSVSRGESWEPEADGSNYGNINHGGYELPGSTEGYDWNYGVEGLGDLIARPGFHGGMKRPSRMVVLNRRRGTIMPLLADRAGNVFARRGGSIVRLGHVDRMSGRHAFGRRMANRITEYTSANDGDVAPMLNGWADFRKKAEKFSKKVASRTTPSGFLYERLKKNPKLYREYRKGAKVAMPYVMIVGGVVVSVASVGIASPAGAAMIAGGVVSAGAQVYSDVKSREVRKAEEKALNAQIEADRINDAIDSTRTVHDSYGLEPSGGPAAGEIPGGDWPNEYAGDGVWADFLNLTDAFPS